MASAIGASFFVNDLYEGVADIGRIEFPGDLLETETEPGEPVNFLIIGLDSALGLDENDSVTFGRRYDDRGTHNADSISLLRVDPVGGQAWAMSIPRDLLVEVPGSGMQKINASSLIGGAELLVRTISHNFDVRINHYVQLDFLAFRDVVEELGGVEMVSVPLRDFETGFAVAERGCTVLDGRNALGSFDLGSTRNSGTGPGSKDGSADLGRIERQQQFVIAAIDRAIARGARNPTTLAGLIDAAAESVVLDQGLTPAELIDLADAFTNFSSDTLETFSPAVVDLFDDEGRWEALGMAEDLDAPMFQVFRGGADGMSLSDVRFSVAGVDAAVVVSDTELLRALGFSVGTERIVVSAGVDNVIVYPAGARETAETLARYVVPVPALVEDPSSTEMTLVLGSSHEGISFFFPQDVDETLAAIDALGEVAIPALATATTTTAGAASTTSAVGTESTTTVPATTTTFPTSTTTLAPATTTSTTTTTTTTALLPGRPPEGETRG